MGTAHRGGGARTSHPPAPVHPPQLMEMGGALDSTFTTRKQIHEKNLGSCSKSFAWFMNNNSNSVAMVMLNPVYISVLFSLLYD